MIYVRFTPESRHTEAQCPLLGLFRRSRTAWRPASCGGRILAENIDLAEGGEGLPRDPLGVRHPHLVAKGIAAPGRLLFMDRPARIPQSRVEAGKGAIVLDLNAQVIDAGPAPAVV